MELGLGFDDEDIAEQRKPKRVAQDAFVAKTAEPCWFIDSATDEVYERTQIHKFRGDYYYLLRQYESSLQEYECQLELLPESNVVCRWEALESICRCHVALCHAAESLDVAHTLTDLAWNADHKCVALQILASALKCAGKTDELITILQKLVKLHPQNPSFWLQLGDVYSAIATASMAGRIGLKQLPGEHLNLATLCFLRCKTLLDILASTCSTAMQLFRDGSCNTATLDERLHGLGWNPTETASLCQEVRSCTVEREAELSEELKILVADMDAAETEKEFDQQWQQMKSFIREAKQVHVNTTLSSN